MTDLAALGGTHTTNFARAIRWEVVMMHVALALDRLDSVKALPFVEHAQRADAHDLRLATLEQTRTMNARQITGHNMQRTNLINGTTISALARLDNHLAHRTLLKTLAGSCDIRTPSSAFLFREALFLDACLQLFDFRNAIQFIGVFQGGSHIIVVGLNALSNARVGFMNLVLDRRRVHLGKERGLMLAECSDGFLAEVHSSKHIFFGDFLGTRFYHGDEAFRTSNGQLKIGVLHFGVSRVHNELARFLVAANAHASSRALKRCAAHHQSGGRAHNADDIGGIFAIAHKRRSNNVNFLLETLGKARTNRTVNHASRQRAKFRRTSFAFQVAARNAANRVHLFNVVNGQREEVVVLLFAGDNRGHQNRGVTLAYQNSTRSLFCQLTGLELVLLAVKLELFNNFFHSFLSFSSCMPYCTQASSTGQQRKLLGHEQKRPCAFDRKPFHFRMKRLHAAQDPPEGGSLNSN